MKKTLKIILVVLFTILCFLHTDGYSNAYAQGNLTSIESFTVDKTNVFTGNPFTATAIATSKNKPLYKFFIGEQKDGKWAWTVIQNYSEKNSVTWSVNKPGNYKLSVYVKDSTSTKDPDTFKQCDITVNIFPTTIKSFTTDKNEVFTGNPFTATAIATSKNKPLYKFFIGKQKDGKWAWTVIQNYSEKNSVTWSVNKPGNYRLSVYVKDSTSTKDPDTFKQCDITVNIFPTTIKSFATDKNEVFTGNPFTATAIATSKNKPLYKFFIGEQKDGKWAWTVIQNYSEKNSVTWSVNKPGNYRLSVYVKDSASTKDPDTFKQCDITINIFPTTIKSFATDKNEVFTGNPFTATAIATSKNKPLYKFFIGEQKDGKWAWTVIQNYSEKNSVTWSVNKPGNYRLSVYVKDSASTKDPDTFKQCDITVVQTEFYKNTYYNITLSDFVDKQMGKNPQTDLYGGGWQTAKREDVERYANPHNYLHFTPVNDSDNAKTLQISASCLNVRSGPGTTYSILTSVSRGQIYAIQGESNGWYKITTDIATGWISGSYVVLVGSMQAMPKLANTIQITGNYLRVRSTPVDGEVLDFVYSGEAYEYQSISPEGWYKITTKKGYTGWVSNDYAIQIYSIPNGMYQFLILSGSTGISSSDLDKELSGKGILVGKGQIFWKAARDNNINEIYLLAHALLETGNGTSDLAKGVLVSVVDGKAVTPMVVYNMFGIGARDEDPVRLGSEYAYKQGWFTPEAAIIGGTKWIADSYINNSTYRQDTLYKMRWNPAAPGEHQYATDIGWALKQTRNMDLMLELYQRYNVPLKFDIPIYK